MPDPGPNFIRGESKEKIVLVNSLEELKLLLSNSGIDFSKWGGGEKQVTKTVEDLFIEVKEGETTLFNLNGKIIRKIHLAGIIVLYKEPQSGKYFILKEQHQYFFSKNKDGDIDNGYKRERANPLSLSEKLKLNELPDSNVVKRALNEELFLKSDPKSIKYLGKETDLWKGDKEVARNATEGKPSKSYPGIISKSVNDCFLVELKDEQYSKEGYIEVQENMSSCFKWEEIREDETLLIEKYLKKNE